jgi:hypothetical protein
MIVEEAGGIVQTYDQRPLFPPQAIDGTFFKGFLNIDDSSGRIRVDSPEDDPMGIAFRGDHGLGEDEGGSRHYPFNALESVFIALREGTDIIHFQTVNLTELLMISLFKSLGFILSVCSMILKTSILRRGRHQPTP